MLHLQQLSKDFAGKPLFTNISWHLKKGERTGLVGENGAGKSTLMRIIAGLVEPSSGKVQFARGAEAGYLPQEGLETRGRTLFAETLSAMERLQEMEREIEEITAKLADGAPEGAEHDALLVRLGDLQEEFRLKGGFTMEAEAGTVLTGLGFSASDWGRDCGEFSGGWQMRIALAKLLLRKPGVLLLDEPTNHLDIEARNWLGDYLISYPYSVILVSHDRFFLDRVCHRITEVWNNTLTDYHCNYSTYLVRRDERVAALREAKKRQDEEVQKLEDFISRFRYNANKASLVQSRVKQLEKIERIVIPPERRKIHFRFPNPPKSGRIVMELKGVTKRYGNLTVLQSVDLVVEKGERVALVGHNGAGKSTLMRILAGDGFQEGDRIVGHNVTMDYFAQDQAKTLDPTKTVYQEILAEAPYDAVPRLRDLLGAFLFSGDDVEKPTSVLSGGEKNRLALAKMLLRPSNLLLMDEPTNHLDLFSKEVLLDALRSFDGTVVFVSHDRHFIDGLATRVIEVEGGSLTSYHGDYEYYLAKKEGLAVPAAAASVAASIAPLPELSSKLNREEQKQRQREDRKRQKRMQELEAEIGRHETLLAELEEQMADPSYFGEPDRARQGGEEHARLTAAVAALYAEWEELDG